MSCSDHFLSLAAPLFDPRPPITAARCDRFLFLGHRHHFSSLPPRRLLSPRPSRLLHHPLTPLGSLGRRRPRKRRLSRHHRILHYHRPRLKRLLLIPHEAAASGAVPSSPIIPQHLHRPIGSPQRAPPKLDYRTDERVPGYPRRSCVRRRFDSRIPSITSLASPRSQFPICSSYRTRTFRSKRNETPILS
ncbi:hypothetical protein BO94DRAFT_392594 [Aspergillus sclerotioniger CBS 115572]|uniref:Uncharacterized protein n=1 Tax=Aspergillus sclerotioniger CBS 115572 TaxID=1450535 RepID=A0A317X1K2_9EURO|nr:hypothetical protein BO94DRAFT_392594 [Aspergillus sclerotioniger CBS 115572]PWY91427.1 hypothetical protein BO94DRAFT_392594 [Aspergillus sclerotioniger CBS 115572]